MTTNERAVLAVPLLLASILLAGCSFSNDRSSCWLWDGERGGGGDATVMPSMEICTQVTGARMVDGSMVFDVWVHYGNKVPGDHLVLEQAALGAEVSPMTEVVMGVDSVSRNVQWVVAPDSKAVVKLAMTRVVLLPGGGDGSEPATHRVRIDVSQWIEAGDGPDDWAVHYLIPHETRHEWVDVPWADQWPPERPTLTAAWGEVADANGSADETCRVLEVEAKGAPGTEGNALTFRPSAQLRPMDERSEIRFDLGADGRWVTSLGFCSEEVRDGGVTLDAWFAGALTGGYRREWVPLTAD